MQNNVHMTIKDSFLFFSTQNDKVFYNLYFSHNLTCWQLWILLWKLLCFKTYCYFIIYLFVLAWRLKPCMYIFVDKPNFLFFGQFAFLLCQNYNSILRTYFFSELWAHLAAGGSFTWKEGYPLSQKQWGKDWSP